MDRMKGQLLNTEATEATEKSKATAFVGISASSVARHAHKESSCRQLTSPSIRLIFVRRIAA